MKTSTFIIIVLIFLAAFTFFSEDISSFVGKFEATGDFTYTYLEGDTPITQVTFNIDPELAENIKIDTVPSGWSYTMEGSTLVLSGGSLAPGSTVNIGYHLERYMEPRDTPISAVGITTDGKGVPASGTVVVSETIILKIIYIFIIYKIPILIGVTLLGTGIIVVEKLRPPPQTVPRGTPVEVPKEEPPIDTPETGVPTEIKYACGCGYEWRHRFMQINVFPSDYMGGVFTMKRLPDDPMPLKALAIDMHALIHICTCNTEEGEEVGREIYDFKAKVRYEWRLVSGEGGFIKINDDKPKKTDIGEQVIYQPPDITDEDEVKKVTILVTAYHDDPTKPPDHDPVTATIQMEISRKVDEEGQGSETNLEVVDPGDLDDYYLYKITVIKDEPMGNPMPPEGMCECVPEHFWKRGTPIQGDIIYIPDEVAYGDYVRLEATGTDMDELVLSCIPAGERCIEPATTSLKLLDNLIFEWSASAGDFPRGSTGRKVVWQAPDVEGPVEIKLVIKDEGDQFKDDWIVFKKKIIVRKLGIDLVKTPKSWLPKATAGSVSLKATIYMCKEGKWVYPGRKKFIRFRLKKVSKEPGVCLNYPRNGNRNPDLFFYEEKMKDNYILKLDKTKSNDCPTEILVANDNPRHQHHYLGTVLKKRSADAKPIIRCEDYGAIGYLEAEANHCVSIPPRDDESTVHKDCKVGSNMVKIPRDDNNNDIADAAPQDDGGAAPNKDEDNIPVGDGYKGDGLTNYEEYRGFIVGGYRTINVPLLLVPLVIGTRKRHIRTDIKKKDVFIYDENNIGTGYLNTSGLIIHRIFDPDLFNGTGSRVINFNRQRHTGGEQHGLWLRNRNMPGLYGMSCGGNNGPPRNKTHVCVNVSICRGAGEPPGRLDNTIAHELAHGLNVWHHGEGGNHNCNGRTFNRQGKLTSGVENCIMRYDKYATGWCHGNPHHRHLYINATGAMVDRTGTVYCSSTTPTGLNSRGAGHLNTPDRGNCMRQFRVKDW